MIIPFYFIDNAYSISNLPLASLSFEKTEGLPPQEFERVLTSHYCQIFSAKIILLSMAPLNRKWRTLISNTIPGQTPSARPTLSSLSDYIHFFDTFSLVSLQEPDY